MKGNTVFTASITRGFDNAHIAKSCSLIEKKEDTAIDLPVPVTDRLQKRTDDDAGHTGMIFQRRKIDIQEDSCATGGNCFGLEGVAVNEHCVTVPAIASSSLLVKSCDGTTELVYAFAQKQPVSG